MLTSACEFKGAGFPLLMTGHGLLGWSVLEYLRACFHEGGGPQVGEVTCGGLPHLTCKRDHIKMRDCMDRRLPHLSGLPHLPGVPHLHVNRPLKYSILSVTVDHESDPQLANKANYDFCFILLQRGSFSSQTN